MASKIRPRLLITLPMPSQYLRSLERVFDLDCPDTPTTLSQEQVLTRIRAQPPDAIFFAGKTKIDKELLTVAGEKLKMLATFSVGYDHIDVKECHKRGIPIGYTPGKII